MALKADGLLFNNRSVSAVQCYVRSSF